MGEQPGKDFGVGGDKSTNGAITACQILRRDDGNHRAVVTLDEQNFGVIVGEECALDNLGDERPEFERLVGRLMVEHQVDARYFVCLANKEKAAQELLGNGKRSLPYLSDTDLLKHPLQYVSNLHRVREISLIRLFA